jgi:hypothetical protein
MRQTGIDGAVGSQPISPRAAHELVGGQAELLAGKIMQREVNRRQSMDAQTPPARIGRRFVKAFPQRRNLHRIGAPENFRCMSSPDVRRRGFKKRLDGFWRGVTFSDACSTIPVRQFHDHGVDGPVTVLDVAAANPQRNDFDRFNHRHVLPQSMPARVRSAANLKAAP